MDGDILEIRIQRDAQDSYQCTVVLNGKPVLMSDWDYAYNLPSLQDLISTYRTYYDPKE